MPRFRFISKKRGEHRTTSDVNARLALGGFFAVLAALGAAILSVVLQGLTIAEWRANYEFVETACTVTAARVVAEESEGRTRFRPEISFRYTVGGRTYDAAGYDAAQVFSTDETASRSVLEQFVVGRRYPCWYDPQNPGSAVVARGYSWFAWLIPLLPASFTAVGVGGLIYLFFTWGKSAEHRKLLEQVQLNLFDEYGAASVRRYPTVPEDPDAANGAGTTLGHRVPSLPTYGSWLISCLAVLWNVATAWFVVRAALGYWAGRPDDYADAPLLLPFVGVGAYLAYRAGRRWLTTFGIEPTVVEISAHPLYPGGTYELHVEQPGRRKYRRYSVRLICHEEATFSQGTNTRTHTVRVFERELLQGELSPGATQQPPSRRIAFQIPLGAMHSFQSPHNAVRWRLIVRGEPLKWPTFEREFSLVVYPGRRGEPYV